MKNRLPLIGSVASLVFLGLAICGTTLAKPPRQAAASPTPAANAGEPKPGTLLTGNVIVATPITKEDAAKKYPAQKGNYIIGERDVHAPSGVIASPYPPHQLFDCSKIGHGELALDTHTNRVFTRP